MHAVSLRDARTPKWVVSVSATPLFVLLSSSPALAQSPDAGIPTAPPAPPQSLVPIPAGPFYKGCNPPECPDFFPTCCTNDTRPQHEVITPAYFIDRYEVTVERYRACVDLGLCTAPEERGPLCNYEFADRAQHPINCVDLEQAEAFCAFDGKRVCSESEWEKAAHGGCELYPEGFCAAGVRPYSFGGYSTSTLCAFMNYDEGGWGAGLGLGCGLGTTWAVGSRPLATSPYGVMDMNGNETEHTADCLTIDYLETPREGSAYSPPECLSTNVKRGGNFNSPAYSVYSWWRIPFATHNDDYTCCGIRCCADGAE